jgi:hypothetical protein
MHAKIEAAVYKGTVDTLAFEIRLRHFMHAA